MRWRILALFSISAFSSVADLPEGGQTSSEVARFLMDTVAREEIPGDHDNNVLMYAK